MVRSIPSIAVWAAVAAAACAASPPHRPAPAHDAQPAAAKPARPPSIEQATELRLPFEGTWAIIQGYHGAETHRGYAAYALDFVLLNEDGRAHARSGRRATDWYGFGARVLAAADGLVVRAVGDRHDNPVLGAATAANTVILQHGDHEFTEYVHLQRGSLRVRVGERVRAGQVLARCGNSGAQTPHLHWAMLSSIDPIRTRPARFARFQLRDAQGRWRLAQGVPSSGDVVRAEP